MFYPSKGGVGEPANLWKWLQSVLSGVAAGGALRRPPFEVWSVGKNGGWRTWAFEPRAAGQGARGPELNGKTGEIAIEELHIAHEGLRLEAGA